MINEDIYGSPSTWDDTQYVPFAKTVNYGTSINDAELADGVNTGKTPVNELIENSICTAALGSESLYSNIIWEHNGELIRDKADYTPYFYANCYDSSGFIAAMGSVNINLPRYNAWKTFQPDVGAFQNKSLHSRVIGEFQPKKILYEMIVGVCPADNYWNMNIFTLGAYLADATLQSSYPKIFYAGLRAYFDNSSTDTPNREVSAGVRLFGVCINRELTPFTLDYNIDYTLCRGYNNYNSNTHIPLYGQPRTYIGKGSNYYNFCLAPEDDITFDTNDIHIMHDYSPEFIEYLIKQAACFGVFVRVSNDSGLPTSTIPLDNDDIICGILVNGCGHGDYTRGNANRDNDIWGWQTNRDSNFDPYNPPDPNVYSDHTTLPSAPGVMNSTTYVYVQKVTGASQVFTLLKSIVGEIATLDDMQFKMLFLGQEPLSNIISAKRIHFQFPPSSHIGSATTIWLGAYETKTTAIPLATEFQTVDFPAKPIVEKYGNFLDYEPYTTISLYIPYCGAMKLPTAVFMGHSCKFTIHVNSRTGDMQAIIYVDNIEFATMEGNLAEDLAVSGLAMATYVSRKRELEHQKNLSLISGMNALMGHAAGATISGAMNNTLGASLQAGMAAASAFNVLEEYSYVKLQLAHAQPQTLLIQKAVPEIGQLNCLTPYLLIMRPRYEEGYDEEAYSKTIGHSCYRVGNINSFRGLTQAINPLLDDISATLTEKQMIIEALREGVILDE